MTQLHILLHTPLTLLKKKREILSETSFHVLQRSASFHLLGLVRLKPTSMADVVQLTKRPKLYAICLNNNVLCRTTSKAIGSGGAGGGEGVEAAVGGGMGRGL